MAGVDVESSPLFMDNHSEEGQDLCYRYAAALGDYVSLPDMSGDLACVQTTAAFIVNNLVRGAHYTSEKLDREWGRDSNKPGSHVTAAHWMLQQGMRLEAFNPPDVMANKALAYGNKKLSFQNYLVAYQLAHGRVDLDSIPAIKAHLENTYIPDLQTTKTLQLYAIPEQYKPRGRNIAPEDFIQALTAGSHVMAAVGDANGSHVVDVFAPLPDGPAMIFYPDRPSEIIPFDKNWMGLMIESGCGATVVSAP